jgi:hypothetical protein
MKNKKQTHPEQIPQPTIREKRIAQRKAAKEIGSVPPVKDPRFRLPGQPW